MSSPKGDRTIIDETKESWKITILKSTLQYIWNDYIYACGKEYMTKPVLMKILIILLILGVIGTIYILCSIAFPCLWFFSNRNNNNNKKNKIENDGRYGYDNRGNYHQGQTRLQNL